MVREPNVRMCRWDCKPAVRIPFAVNQNMLIFCANTRTGCAGCPLHAPGVLCSPQVCGKLINHTPIMCCMRTVQRVSGALVYTKLYIAHNTTCILLHTTSPHTPKTKVTKLLKANSYRQLKPLLCRRNYVELETIVAIFHNLIQT